ncbi:MAG: primosomal protein N' [Candidatus Saccharicenans sp.]
MSIYCEVIFPLPVFQTFLYRLPEHLEQMVKVGSRVLAPLGPRKRVGYVVEIKRLEREPDFEVKEIAGCEELVLPEKLMKLASELSRRSLSAPGLFLEMAEPRDVRQKVRMKLAITEKGMAELDSGRIKGRRRQILTLLKDRDLSPLYIRRVLKIKEISPLVKELAGEGLIVVKEKKIRKKQQTSALKPHFQQLALPVWPEGMPEPAKKIIEALEKRSGGSFLLTGEFERRLEFLKLVVEFNSSNIGFTLVLVPEIQRLERFQRFQKSFPGPAVVWHSQLTGKQKSEAWSRLSTGQVRIILGTRAALFLPVEPLSLIIIDEEQDENYYQTEGPPFDVREAASLRARLENGLVIHMSDCPRVSTYFHHQQKAAVIDLGKEEIKYTVEFHQQEAVKLLKGNFGQEVARKLEEGEKVFFLVNRKGYAGYVYCPGCGFVARCEKCRIPLKLDMNEGELICDYCGMKNPLPDSCPVCQQKLRPGRGKGSQFLKEQLERLFPGKTVELLEEGAGERDCRKALKRIMSGRSSLVVGTDYALSRLPEKSFSWLVLLSPEFTLNLPDFQAGEKTFSRISRARELLKSEEKSRLVVLTSGPPPEMLTLAVYGDYENFYRREIDYRQLLNYPPFSSLLEIGIEGRSLRSSGRGSRLLLESLQADFPALELIGPKLTRKKWKKGQREVKLLIRLPATETERLLSYLIEFRQKRPPIRLRARIFD